MGSSAAGGLAGRFKRIANEAAELPVIRWLAKPIYRKLFRRPDLEGYVYYGRYESYSEALADAPPALPASYDVQAAGRMYVDRHQKIRVSDYPLVYWLQRQFDAGQRTVFDLGGHIGVSYYGFEKYMDYPADMRWVVHDTPSTVAAGRAWALRHDPSRRLSFADSPDAANGCDVLITSGALQYLDYTLPELLERLPDPPAHVLINQTPMHPETSYFTLQNISIANCPYRVMAVPEFISAMQALGYELQEQWESYERQLRVPFEPDCTVDCYRGFYLQKPGGASARQPWE